MPVSDAPLVRSSSPSFNPRPALRPGDASVADLWPPCSHVFQSAPGLEAGRCRKQHDNLVRILRFQSAPGLEAGRCIGSATATSFARCFNPRPALRPGDASFLFRLFLAHLPAVSIRARP